MSRASFSVSDAAMEGFRMLGRRPLAFLVWMSFYAIVCAVCFGLGFLILAPDLPSLASTLPFGSPADVAKPLLARAKAMQNFGTPAGFALQAILGAAVYRQLLQPNSSAAGYLRLSRAEAMQFLTSLVLSSLLIGGVVLLVVFGLTSIGVTLIATEPPRDEAQAITATGLTIAGLIAALGAIYTAVRLSLAPVMTFEAGTLKIFKSWTLTRGHFWRIFFAFILAWLFSIIFGAVMVVLAGSLGLSVYSMTGAAQVYAAHGASIELLQAAWPALLVAAPPVIAAQVLAITLYKAAAGHIFLALRPA